VTEAIHTARLVLRPIDAECASRILAGDLGGLHVARGWPQDDTSDGLRMEVDAGVTPVCWLVTLAGTVIGELGWKGGPGPDGATEIGYSLVPAHRGQGYGTEAVAGFVRWASGHPPITRLVAQTLTDNVASRRVLEKTGFTVSESKEGCVYWLRDTAVS